MSVRVPENTIGNPSIYAERAITLAYKLDGLISGGPDIVLSIIKTHIPV